MTEGTKRTRPPPAAKAILLLAAAGLAIALGVRWRGGPAGGPVVELSGGTMGTTYHIAVAEPGWEGPRLDALTSAVAACLAEMDRQMSVYRPDSEISRVNAAGAGEAVEVSADFAGVLSFALDVARRSGGVFDPTVAPLVEVWGFGANGRRAPPPGPAEIEAARADVGHGLVRVEGRRVVKDRPGTRLDLNAIAPGYGVDAVSRALRSLGATNYFVEIGGEVHAAGLNAFGKPWRIGVDYPSWDALPGDSLLGVLHLSGAAVATSGNYRNYRADADGARYTHILDPRTGQSLRRPQTSVSVVARDAMTADALATTLFVMGPDDGLPWLRREFPGVEAYFVLREGAKDALREAETPGFRAATSYERRTAK